MEWAILGIVITLAAVGYFLYGLANKPYIKLKEEYDEFTETMEGMREADRKLDDRAYRQRLLDEDNQN